MKYITTSKHPELKKGIELVESAGHGSIHLGGSDIWFSYIIIKNWLDKGYIKTTIE